MKAFITGVTGFVGAHLAEHLLASGDQVMGACRTGQGASSFDRRFNGQIELLPLDLRAGMDEHSRKRLIDFAPDCMIHLAAISVPADCGREEPTQQAWAVNVEGTRYVLDLAASLHPSPRVLLVSSSYVYAPPPVESPRVDETAPLGPQQGYGKTKLAAEEEAMNAMMKNGVDVVIARSFQHTGPGQAPRMIVPEWARQFARGDQPIRVRSLDTFLDLTDVRDVVKAYRGLVVHGRRGGVYNVGGGVCRRGRDIFASLQRLAGSEPVAMESSPGPRQHAIADISRIKALCGWSPSIPFEQTLADTLAFWRQDECSARW